MSGEVDPRLGQGFEALATGGWSAARDAFESVLADSDVPEAMYGLASALFWLGDMPGTIASYERAFAAFGKRPDPMYAAACALALVLHNKQHLGNRAAANGWLRRATTLIEDNAIEPLRAGLLVVRAYETDDAAQREAWGRQGWELARKTGDHDWELGAMSIVGRALCEQGRVGDGTALLDEAMAGALGGETGLDAVVFTSCATMTACANCAEFERAAQWVRASQRFTEQYGCPFLYIECRTIYGRVLFETGEWGRAETELENAIALARGSAEAFTVQAAATLAELRLAQGRIEDAERLVAEWQGRPETVVVSARIAMHRAEFRRAMSTLGHRLDSIGASHVERAALLDLLGEAEIALGNANDAVAHGIQLGELGATLDCPAIMARGERVRGRALRPTDGAAARRHLAAAISEFVRMGMPYEAARTRLMLAEVAVDTDAELAAAEAGAALVIFESLGARRDADAAAALLRTHNLHAGRPGPRAFGRLSKREQGVLELLGEGLSNPEIASRLFLSRRTVEHHVASILSKLDVQTRAEAGALYLRKALGK